MAGALGRRQLSLADPLGPPRIHTQIPSTAFSQALHEVITHTPNYQMRIRLAGLFPTIKTSENSNLLQMYSHQTIDNANQLPHSARPLHLASDDLNLDRGLPLLASVAVVLQPRLSPGLV